MHRQDAVDRQAQVNPKLESGSGEGSLPRWIAGGIGPLLSATALALLAWAVWGRGTVGYDGLYSLVWAGDLVHGQLPDLTSPTSPTPHPLANLLAMIASLTGPAERSVLEAVAFFSFGALVLLVARVTWSVFGRVAALAAASLAFCGPSLVEALLDTSVDVAFLALVLLATAWLIERKPVSHVLGVLAVAGLIRPEAWLFSAVLAAWAVATSREAGARKQAGVIALALVGPAAWMLVDLLLVGDPLHSLHGTRDLAEQLSRPRSADTALRALPSYLFVLVGQPVVWAGSLCALACVWLMPMRALLVPAIMFGGFVAFVAIGMAGLSVIPRYLLLPATMLIVLAGGGIAVWRRQAPGTPQRKIALALGAYCGILVLAALYVNGRDAHRFAGYAHVRAEIYSDLHAILSSPRNRQEIANCRPLVAYNHRPVPLLALELDRSPRSIEVRAENTDRGLILAPATERTARYFVFTADVGPAGIMFSDKFRIAAENRSWMLLSSCPAKR